MSRAREVFKLAVFCIGGLVLSNCTATNDNVANSNVSTTNGNASRTMNRGNGGRPAGANVTANLTPLPPEVLNAPIQTVDGRTIRLADYAGKVVVLDLWATWCPPCRDEIPHLVEISREYAGRGVEVIGLDVDQREDAQTITSFMERFGANYTLGLAEDIVGPAMVRERGGAIPQTYVITRDGRILTRFVGFNPSQTAPQLRAAVERAANTQ